ncbi:GAF domain-containing protein [Streptomyces sp. NPDC088801]|uniref:GAF domain-containing protein n=1 Tax=Streptomyces sp. NPDC088801 TaxID=3365903 RepID=UPI0038301A14
MNRERRLAQAFVVLADTYAVEFDPLQLFRRLVHTCQDLLDVDEAGVMIADARGSLKTMATTEEDDVFAELLRLQNGHGPCVDCYRAVEPVSVPDMATEHERWPKLATAMADAGYESLQAVPVRLHERPLGALTLLRRRPGRLAEDDVHLAQALADSAALALMHWSIEPTDGEDVVTRVQGVIAAKAQLEIAKGMVAQYGQTTIGEAARRLSAYGSRNQVRLTEIAHSLVTRSVTPADVIAGQPLG